MNAFDFVAPSRIVFGWGRIAEIGAVASSLGRRAFLVWGSRTLSGSDVGKKIIADLKAAGVSVFAFQLPPGEPEVATIDHLAEQVRAEKPTRDDVVIGIGGGSGMDAAKAIAGFALDPEKASIKDFLEGVGTGRKIGWPVLPIVAVPTTAGTGSEATFNAVVSSRNPPFKKSFRDHRLMPKVALIDPQLACSAPKNITAWAGMDALTQLIEALISKKATRATGSIALGGLQRILDGLRCVNCNPSDQESREYMAAAALRSGLALANGGLGVAHAVAAGLGALKGTPHGLACAVMLPAALTLNSDALTESDEIRGADWSTIYLMAEDPDKYDFDLVDKEQESHAKLVTGIRLLLKEFNIPTHLSALGVTKDDIPELVRLSQGSSLSGNPKAISEEELATLLESML
jgi:alcohol dehydrogenase class IV